MSTTFIKQKGLVRRIRQIDGKREKERERERGGGEDGR